MNNESGQNLEKAGEENHKSDNQTDQSKNKISPSISSESGLKSSVPPAIPSQNNPENSRSHRKTEPPNWCDITTLILEFVGIVGLGIYCFYTYKEWRTFDSERITMESEFKASQEAALNEQKIAEKQLKEIQETRNIDERAWVFVNKVYSETNEVNTNHVIFTISFKNTGKTPAVNCKGTITLASGFNLESILKGFNLESHSISIGSLAPQQAESFASSLEVSTLTRDEISKLIKSGTNFYIFGTIWYGDIFRKNHWSQFSFSVGDDLKTFNFAPIHHDCDDN